MILGIESSCDDSSLALMSEDFALVRYEKITQESEHSNFGGVVPELAARLHTAAIPDLIAKFSLEFSQIDAIAVTNEPGLSVSLMAGVYAAKSLSIALNKPLIAVNHLIGHVYSLFLDRQITLPLGVLLVSGGHTMILSIDERGKIEVLAQTSDDSFGESFDKVAKMLGFGYPGGAIIDKIARAGSDRFKFTIPIRGERLEFSFSGLKNQVRMKIAEFGADLDQNLSADIAASFQKTAVEHILDKLRAVFKMREFKHFGAVGGASANSLLRAEFTRLCEKNGCEPLFAPMAFCSDNAAMIARAGVDKFKHLRFSSDLQMQPRCELNGKFVI